MQKERKIIAIIGPTASGKTGIGVKLAKEFNGEIISADSRQVYRGLDLGTGKEGKLRFPSSNQYSVSSIQDLRQSLRYIDDIPQWMIDICESGEEFSLFDYLPLARMAIEDIFSRGKTPIIVGGTGLYVQGIVEGFELKRTFDICHSERSEESQSVMGSFASTQDDIKGNNNREQLERMTLLELRELLKSLDEESYSKVDQNNPHRLIRAIEKAQEGLIPTKIKPDFEVLEIALDLPKEELDKRIDRRVDERFEQGMLEEVIGLLKQGVDPEWLMRLGLEYRIITSFLLKQKANLKFKIYNLQIKGIKDSKEFEEMSGELKNKIHQYAKRQMTWFRRFPRIKWENDYEKIKKLVNQFLKNN